MRKLAKQKRVWLVILCFLLMAISVAAEPGASAGEEQLVTATFFDSDLREALKEISLQTGIVFVCDENIRGIITMELKEVPLEKALRMMVSGGGFAFRRIDDYYIIGLPDPRNPTFSMLCETAVYQFKNIDLDSARTLIPDNYKNYIKLDSTKGIAVITAPASLISMILADLAIIDGSRSQIRIKALVTEVRSDVLKEWGMDLLKVADLPSDYLKSTVLDVTNGAITINGLSDFGSIYGNIKAMVNDKKATIQADPVVVVTEGKTGELFVGDKRTLILQSQGNNLASSSTETMEAGTFLKVTPRLFDGQIELAIGQKVSSFSDEGRTDQIMVRTNEFNSVVRFMPGQTVMIAGLTAKNTSNSVSKTPILGDIPFLRFFFKQKTDQKIDSQLLIFITAEVLTSIRQYI